MRIFATTTKVCIMLLPLLLPLPLPLFPTALLDGLQGSNENIREMLAKHSTHAIQLHPFALSICGQMYTAGS